MNKYVVAAGIGAIFSLQALADGSITGRVLNKATGEPIDFATVQLIDGKTEKLLPIGVQTDENGDFVLPKVANGNYMVQITNLGSVPQERVAVINDSDVALGIIHLADDVKMLQEVVVEGMRSQMRFELDRRVFNVDANLISAGQSASELLGSIPSVDVDQDGEVSLRGSTSVTIWINGKESGLTADNRAQILEQIPGETIERIEVITNPSAKYSPEGSSGIINIVLKRDRTAGYFGSAELGANTRGGANANFSFNYNSTKWDAYASVGMRLRHNSNGSRSERKYLTDGDPNGLFLNSEGAGKNHGDNIFLRAGATYYLTKNDEFSLSGFAMFGHRWGHSTTTYTSNVPGQWLSDIQYSRNRSNMRGYHGEFNYLHRFSENHTIEAVLGYNNWGGPGWTSYEETMDYGADDLNSDSYRQQEQDINTSNWEAKVDYSNKLTSWLKLDAGYNGTYSHENSPVTTWNSPEKTDLTINRDLYNRFIYNNNITAFYLMFGGGVSNFSYSAGLRAEAWQTSTRSIDFAHRDDINAVGWEKRNNFALFPSAFLSYSLPYDNEIQVNYTRRIRRPWGGQLNSFVNISDPTNISAGNPDLQPTYTNAFELNYIKTWTNHMISVAGYLRTSTSVMNRISTIYDGTMYTTSANVGDNVNSGVEIVVKNSLFRRVLDLTTTANLYNSHVKGWTFDETIQMNGVDVPMNLSRGKQNSFAWDIRVMAQVRLPWGLSFQATGGYNSRQITAQGSREPGWNVDAGLRKSLGNWSFTLNCRDIFNSRKFNSFTNDLNYTQHSERWRGGRTLRLTIKYSFGNMKSNNQKNQRNNSEPMDGSGYGEEMGM